MVQVTGLGAVPVQTFSMQSPNGDGVIYFTLSFRPRVRSWFLDIKLGNYAVNGFKLLRGPNVFRQYRNTFGFGITIATTDMSEPAMINDFSSGRVTMYLLTGGECDSIESLIEAGTIVG